MFFRNRVAKHSSYNCRVMKKEYKPLNLVMNGRYAVLFGVT